jgi:hypothetical protein
MVLYKKAGKINENLHVSECCSQEESGKVRSRIE